MADTNKKARSGRGNGVNEKRPTGLQKGVQGIQGTEIQQGSRDLSQFHAGDITVRARL
jgi:hypothetical protein